MFNLEQSIADWRQEMKSAGIKAPVPLDELELHLREEIRVLVSGGTPEPEAFQLAAARLGGPGSVSGEFKKTGRAKPMPMIIGPLLWAGVLITLALFLLRGLASGKLSLLLFSHIFTLTAGYLTAFVAGGFGICHVCLRLCHKLSLSDQRSLRRAIGLFTQISTALIAVGVLLGTIWSRQNRGAFFTTDPREIGPLCALTWFMVASFLQRFDRTDGQVTRLTAIGGNIMVILAWFRALAVSYSNRGHGFGNHSLLAAFIAIHLVFLMLAGVPDRAHQLKSS